MKRLKVKNAGVIFLCGIILWGIISILITYYLIIKGIVREPPIFMLIFLVGFFTGYYIINPSLAKEEKRIMREKIKSKKVNNNRMKCDAQKIDHPGGGFSCSILGETLGANWLWEDAPYKEQIQNPPPCDACLKQKTTLFGKKQFFSCWVMGEFKVLKNQEALSSKIQSLD